ncbi:MAG TPA: hypothetical protein VFZ25_06635, partial [Chloroflexota bacterium]|nr:hypothetical protein [Chloroflexota bacterium]
MSTRLVPTPTSRPRFGHARAEITPPVGIYHRMWGAARHDRASGVHRPLYADIVAFGARDAAQAAWIQIYLDGVGSATGHDRDLRTAIASAAGLTPGQVIITYSHTHSG